MKDRYEFHTPQGVLCVDGDVYAEAQEAEVKETWQSGKSSDMLNDWTTWDNVVDGETIYYL